MSQQEIRDLITKAQRSVAAAERLMRDGDRDFAVSRAYYAMFYAAHAMLLSRDIRRSKHSGVIAAFQETFVKSGEVDRRFFHLLRDGFEDRAEGDYGFAVISREQGKPALRRLVRIIHECRREVAEPEARRRFSKVRVTQAYLWSVEEPERQKRRRARGSAAGVGIHEWFGLVSLSRRWWVGWDPRWRK